MIKTEDDHCCSKWPPGSWSTRPSMATPSGKMTHMAVSRLSNRVLVCSAINVPLACMFPLEICKAYDKQEKKVGNLKKDQCSTLLSASVLSTWQGCSAVRRVLHFITELELQQAYLMAWQYVKISLCGREMPVKALKRETHGVTGMIFSTESNFTCWAMRSDNYKIKNKLCLHASKTN